MFFFKRSSQIRIISDLNANRPIWLYVLSNSLYFFHLSQLFERFILVPLFFLLNCGSVWLILVLTPTRSHLSLGYWTRKNREAWTQDSPEFRSLSKNGEILCMRLHLATSNHHIGPMTYLTITIPHYWTRQFFLDSNLWPYNLLPHTLNFVHRFFKSVYTVSHRNKHCHLLMERKKNLHTFYFILRSEQQLYENVLQPVFFFY